MNSVYFSKNCKGWVVPIVLALVFSGISICGCSKIEEDELLGASSPNYNTLFPISTNGLYMTEWSGKNATSNLVLKFQRNFCDFIMTDWVDGKVTNNRYTYTYNHPVATFTPVAVDKSIIKGTTKSGHVFNPDEMSFTDEQNATILLKVIREK